MTDVTHTPAPNMPGVVPHLVCAGAAAAIDFYTAAFGATEVTRLPAPDGKLVHAALALNGGMVMLTDESPAMGALSPKSLGGTPITLHLAVADADAVAARAVAEGATLIMAVQPMFWGDRYGVVEDPFGYRWSLGTPQGAPLSAEELAAAFREAMAAGPLGSLETQN